MNSGAAVDSGGVHDSYGRGVGGSYGLGVGGSYGRGSGHAGVGGASTDAFQLGATYASVSSSMMPIARFRIASRSLSISCMLDIVRESVSCASSRGC